MSILSWDDMYEEGSPLKAAAMNLAALDTKEAVKEFDEKSELLNKQAELKQAGILPALATPLNTQMNPEQLSEANKQVFQNAIASIRKMDELIENGGRVAVGDKYLLNCQADLNQLVPFKYVWAWSLYLTSTEQHWMPGEFALFDAANAFNSIVKGTPKKLLVRYYLNYRYRELLFPEQVMLNCYRIITNPECRQYLLRQSFESALIKHVLADLVELFKVKEQFLESQFATDGDTFKTRYLTAGNLIRNLHDHTFDTKDGPANTALFLEQLLYLYGYVNWTMQIVPMYQLFNALRSEGQMNLGLVKVMKMKLRDIQTQTTFIQLFLSTAFNENPGILTTEFKERVLANFKKLNINEEDLLSTLANSEDEYKEVVSLLKHYTLDFLNPIGITDTSSTPNPNTAWFTQLVDQAKPHVDMQASLSGQGGTLEF